MKKYLLIVFITGALVVFVLGTIGMALEPMILQWDLSEDRKSVV